MRRCAFAVSIEETMTTRKTLHRWVWLGVAGTIALVAIGRADAPAGRYTIANATVSDTKTKLTWQRGVAPSTYAWSDASSFCMMLNLDGTGWRLPSARELQTIVDESLHGPAIDANAFPGTPSAAFWTSSAGTAGMAWAVSFDSGATSLVATTTASQVRCVR
jgi:hypothetical protein